MPFNGDSQRTGLACLAAVVIALGLRASLQTAQSSPPPDEVSLRMLVVSTREEADAILERLRRGENFARLAERVSIDPSARQGGLLGRQLRSALRPELKTALEGVGLGQFTPVVRLPTGFAVLMVTADDSGGSGISAAPGPVTVVDARGSVKFMLGVDGLAEADAALDQQPKVADWNQDPLAICEVRKASLSRMEGSLESFLGPSNEAARAARPPFDIVQAHVGLAQLHLYEGHMKRGIEELEKARQIAASSAIPAAATFVDEALGIAYLHSAEMASGVYRSPGDYCLLPMPAGRGYAKSKDSENAIQHFLGYLKERPGELEVKWLLNVAYMAAGGYPQDVPREHLIPPTAFASAEDLGRFRDVAPQAGLRSVASAGGLIVDDFDNDGHLDVVSSSMDSCAKMTFFHGNGDGTFTDRAASSGLGAQLGGLNLSQADYNNDGCMDILVMRGGWQLPQRRSLLRNNCDGTFTDVTASSGLAIPATSSQTAVWTDIDNDGFLDLFVGNDDTVAQLFLNKRDGTFENISHAAGVDRVMFTKGVAAGDYDGDGYPDLYVSNLNGRNFLYHNNRNRTFTELAETAGVPGPGRGFATWFFDYDNDGRDDIFATSYFISVDESARTYLGLPHNATTLKLYRNLGGGKFQDVTKDVGLDKVFMPMAANFGDIDNDGFLDIYLGTGSPSYGSLVPNVMLRNKAGRSFVDVTASSGLGELHKGHGIAFADLDNDGDEDIVEEVGGSTPGDAHAMRLFENPGHRGDWITLRLVGVKTNRGAVGARIKVTVEDEGGSRRTIYRTVSSGGSFGASPLAQHVGVGKATRIVDLEVRWPTSGTEQHFTDVKRNQWIQITEFERQMVPLERRLVRLGGPAGRP
jgi:ASPIC/UnbV protein/VCBS repeat protein/PPIC-type peptidyl-prolyl cis-trans isomerase-like protein